MNQLLSSLLLLASILSACNGMVTLPQSTAEPVYGEKDNHTAMYTDPSQPVEARVEDLLKRMTLDEKIGQITQVEKNSIRPGDVQKYFVGSNPKHLCKGVKKITVKGGRAEGNLIRADKEAGEVYADVTIG